MAWIARNKNNDVNVYARKPWRNTSLNIWDCYNWHYVRLSSDADEKLIGRHLAWEDEPVEI